MIPKRHEAKIESQVRSTSDLFIKYFGSRPDIGFRKMLLDIGFSPSNPFKPWEPRKPKKGFVAAAVCLFALFAWFTYFSLTR